MEYTHCNFVGDDRRIDGAPMFSEFNARFEEAPPPDPVLLVLHARCVPVVHMSGATKFFAS